jgi:hypothetical protein
MHPTNVFSFDNCLPAWTLVAILLTFHSCGFVSPLPAAQEPSGTLPAKPDNTAPKPPADKSLSLDELLKAGLPACDRDWNSTEVRTASEVLSNIARKDAAHLPRYRSERSGQAFERLTADANLEFYRNKTLPLNQRMPGAIEHLNSMNQMLKLYFDAFTREKVGDSEIIELLGAQLKAAVVMTSLADELLPTLDRNDPKFPVRMDGLKTMKGGMAQMVFGTLITLTESKAYRPAERRRLIGHMQSTFPKMLPMLLEDSRNEALQQIRNYVNDPLLQELRPDLEKLLMAVETTP